MPLPARRLSRRRFLVGTSALAALGILGGCMSAPPWGGRTPRVARLGWLTLGTPPEGEPPAGSVLREVLETLRGLGWTEGQNLELVGRYAETGRPDRLPELAAELVALNVDVMVTTSGPAHRAAMGATQVIPIVMGVSSDPVAQGFVASLARPGGNVTGTATVTGETWGKRLEMLREMVPGLARLAVIFNAAASPHQFDAIRGAAAALGLDVQELGVRGPPDFAAAFAAVSANRPEALVATQDPLTLSRRADIAAFALGERLPTAFEDRSWAEAGGLLN
jgi:putative tryptophan/tyrosine transport system substrate-binding protein